MDSVGRFIILLGIVLMAVIYHYDINEKSEQIKLLEQSLQEQIQEAEVYRNILETYQTEGIINE